MLSMLNYIDKIDAKELYLIILVNSSFPIFLMFLYSYLFREITKFKYSNKVLYCILLMINYIIVPFLYTSFLEKILRYLKTFKLASINIYDFIKDITITQNIIFMICITLLFCFIFFDNIVKSDNTITFKELISLKFYKIYCSTFSLIVYSYFIAFCLPNFEYEKYCLNIIVSVNCYIYRNLLESILSNKKIVKSFW